MFSILNAFSSCCYPSQFFKYYILYYIFFTIYKYNRDQSLKKLKNDTRDSVL